MGDIQSNSHTRNHSAVAVAPHNGPTSRLRLASGGASLSMIDAFADLFSQMDATAVVPSTISHDGGETFPEHDDDSSSQAAEWTETRDESPVSASDQEDASEPTHVVVVAEDVKVEKPAIQPSHDEQAVESSDSGAGTSDPELVNRGDKKQVDPQAKSQIEPSVDSATVETGTDLLTTEPLTQPPPNQPRSGEAAGEDGTPQKTVVGENADVKPTLRDPKPQSSEIEKVAGNQVQEESLPSDEGKQDHRESRRERRESREVHAGSKESQAEKNAVGQERAAEQRAVNVAKSAAMAEASASVETASQTFRAMKPAVGIPAPAVAAATVTTTAATVTPAHATSNVPSAGIGRGTSPAAPASIPAATPKAGSDASGKPANATDQSSTTDLISRAKLIQRVSKAFQHLGSNGGQVRIRLAPAELGTVRLEMQVSDRKMQTRVIAETEAAASALREHLPELRMRLESQGIQVEKMSVEVESESHRGDQSSQESFAQDDPRQFNRSRDTWRPDHRPTAELAPATYAPSLAPVTSQLPTRGVDVQL